MNKLSKENTFDYDSKELIGVMRFDFYDGGLANQWNPRELIIELNNKKEIDLRRLQEELNYIQFTLIKEFNKVVELCNGTGYSNETLVYIDLDIAKYVNEEVPYELIKSILENFSKVLTESSTREQQKKLLHMIISEITINELREIDSIKIKLDDNLINYLSKEEGVPFIDTPSSFMLRNVGIKTLNLDIAI